MIFILTSDYFLVTGIANEVHAVSAVFPSTMSKLAYVGFQDHHYERSKSVNAIYFLWPAQNYTAVSIKLRK